MIGGVAKVSRASMKLQMLHTAVMFHGGAPGCQSVKSQNDEWGY